MDNRSELLARVLSRHYPIDELTRNAFKSPVTADVRQDCFSSTVPMLGEILNPSFLDQLTGLSKRYDLHAQFLRGLAFCLHHTRTQFDRSHPIVSDALLLYSLMPIYLSSSKEKIVPAVDSAMNKLRHANCIVGWLNVMSTNVGYRWVEEQTGQSQFLESSIESCFRISISKIAGLYWDHPGMQSSVSATDKGLWEIACQIVRGASQIHIPKSLILGVVSWEKILQHWNSLKKELESANQESLSRSNEPNPHRESTYQESNYQEARLLDTIKSVTPDMQNLAKNQREAKMKVSVMAEPVSKDRRLVEIRSSSDPQLKKVLDLLLQQSREEQTILTIAVVSRLNAEQDKAVNWFSSMIDQIIEESEAEDLKGFVTDAGELALMFYDVDRSDVAYWLRESFVKLRSGSSSRSIHAEASEQLIAGVAMVNAPSRSFQLEQLIDAAWRCRDGAAIQGANAVKTIEVY